jgi:hypothetical protein
MSTFTVTESTTFTVTHARHLASKIATDLQRMHRFYGRPSALEIHDYEVEAVELIKGGYLREVTYGFKRNGRWIEPTLRYTARDFAGGGASDDPGRVLPGADIREASFGSYLTYSSAWSALGPAEQQAVRTRLPFERVSAAEPGMNGYMVSDRTYSSGGRAIDRTSLRSY